MTERQTQLSGNHLPIQTPSQLNASPTNTSVQYALSSTTKTITKSSKSKSKSKSKNSRTRTTYFEQRQKKLTAQAPKAISLLFKGLHIYCTGVRSHSQRKLEAAAWRHGATVHRMCLRKVITHVIADNLCESKINRELNCTARTERLVVVNPQWLLQSIQKNTVLATWDFQIVKAPPKIKTLEQFFKPSQSQSQSQNQRQQQQQKKNQTS